MSQLYNLIRFAVAYYRSKVLVWDLDGTLYFNPKLTFALRQEYLNYYRKHKIKDAKKRFSLEEKKGRDWHQIIGQIKRLSQKELIIKVEKNFPKDIFLEKDNALASYFSKTSKQNFIFTNCLKNQVPEMLKKLGLKNPSKTFIEIISLNDLKEAKPSPLAFSVLSDKLKAYKAEEIIYFGDSLNQDINPAKKLGYKTVFISHWGEDLGGDFNYLDRSKLFNDLLLIEKINPLRYLKIVFNKNFFSPAK